MNTVALHPAPRVPAGRDSLAACAGPSRRAIVGSLLAAPLLPATVSATDLGSAGPSTGHYERWQMRYRALQASPTSIIDFAGWNTVCDAETSILESGAASLKSAEERLWVALANMDCDTDAVLAEDIDALLADRGLNWDVSLVVRALADVRGLSLREG